MTARSTYESSRKNAGPVCTQAQTNAAAAAQESINAASTNGGTSLAFGVSAANDSKIRAANVALQVALQAAQVAKAASEQTAKDTLASTGDVGPRSAGTDISISSTGWISRSI